MESQHLTRAEITAELGIAASTWSAYVSRGQAPQAIGYDPETGARIWDAQTVRHWHQNRPGRGSRSDLQHARKETHDVHCDDH